MLSKRYTIVLADRTTGVVRRFTISVKAAVTVVGLAMGMPMLIGLGAASKARYDVAQRTVREHGLTRYVSPFVTLCFVGALAAFSATIVRNPVLPLFTASLGVDDATLGLIASVSAATDVLV